MARPVLLVVLLFVIVFTSQLDWNPQIVNEAEATPTLAQKQHHVTKRQEDIKEKVSEICAEVRAVEQVDVLQGTFRFIFPLEDV
ncbi:hypothetical protein RJ640_014127 [Escallonia rubra]|uniref:Uncharacterized protein n=1 Tax=Escallonia rubra TaxID=112253 RepID=A0AA88UGS2_9ASTE|nr:hypothetical protein RJ640_014127 [Escallonia rubra]